MDSISLTTVTKVYIIVVLSISVIAKRYCNSSGWPDIQVGQENQHFCRIIHIIATIEWSHGFLFNDNPVNLVSKMII